MISLEPQEGGRETAQVHHVDRQCGASYGGSTMRSKLQRSVIAVTIRLAIATFPDPAKAGAVVTAPFYGGYGYYDYPYTYGYTPWAYGYYYPNGYWHPPGGYYYPRAYRRQYNRPFYRGYW
jgi:hypothetical protein